MSQTQKLDKIFEEEKKKIEIALKKKNKKWLKEDIIQLLAKIALYGKELIKAEDPNYYLSEAKELLGVWYAENQAHKIYLCQ